MAVCHSYFFRGRMLYQRAAILRTCNIIHKTNWFSTGNNSSSNGGLFKNFMENLRKNFEKNKEMQANLRAFEEERNRIVKTDAVKLFRQKITWIQEWLITVSIKSFDITRDGIKSMRSSITKIFKTVSESDIAKKGQDFSGEVSKKAQDTAERLSEQAQVLEKTNVYKTVSKGVETVKEDLLDDVIRESAPYRPPTQVLKRTERATTTEGSHVITENTEIKNVTVTETKESKWKQRWNQLRANNRVSDMLYGLRMKYDESDNLVVRLSRNVTDKIGDAFGGVFTQSDMSQTLSEIHKIDPNFDKEMFISECKYEIIPTVLEAYLQGKLDILRDWCHEAAYNVLEAIIKQNFKKSMTKVLEVQHVDILGAKLLEKGPVMILTFTAQQLTYNDDADIKSDPVSEELENVVYIWALCRDQTIYDPKTAWRVMEFGIQASGRLLV